MLEDKMATMGDSIRKLMHAHVRQDEATFRDAALELIAEERHRNHPLFAVELERILCQSIRPAAAEASSIPYILNGDAPRDSERGLPLVEVREPRRSLDDLVLSPSTRQQIERILAEQCRAEELRNRGLRPLSRLLFCGPPGCGKTVGAECVAHALLLPLVLVRFDAVISSYLGETAANLRKVFDYASARPVVLFFDEFDAVGKERSAEDDHGELKRVVTSLLQMMDGYRGETLTIAASNHQSLLDAGLWRRFDDIILFERPTVAEAEALLARLLRRTKIGPGVRLESAARRMRGWSHADVERAALDACKTAVLGERHALSAADVDWAIKQQVRRRKVVSESSSVDQPSANQPES